MRDWLNIGPTPANEDCEQLGPNYNPAKAKAECRRFIATIRHALGPEPKGCRLRIMANPHDYGTYHEVVCDFDEDIEGSLDYALKCESEAPQNWIPEVPE